MNGLDYPSYEIYFDKIFVPVLNEYCNQTAEVIVRPDLKKRVWECYEKLNRHCKEAYMKDIEKLIDRHKVVACFVYAILQVQPMICSMAIQQGDETSMLLNERLALCFGMSVMRALICAEVGKITDDSTREKLKKVFESEIAFPKVNHGDYRHNLLTQLFHTRKESNYNILSLAETLYLLECYNLVKNGIEEDVFKQK